MGSKEFIPSECRTDVPTERNLFSTVPPIVRELTRGFASKKWSSHNEPVPIPSNAAPAAEAVKEVPSNEKLAMQITDLRLKVLNVERDVAMVRKDIRKIKVAMRHKK